MKLESPAFGAGTNLKVPTAAEDHAALGITLPGKTHAVVLVQPGAE